MVKYMGYYIDGVIFKNKSEIELFLKESHINKIKILHEMLFSGNYDESQMIGISNMITEREKILHDYFKMDWSEIESIPLEGGKMI